VPSASKVSSERLVAAMSLALMGTSACSQRAHASALEYVEKLAWTSRESRRPVEKSVPSPAATNAPALSSFASVKARAAPRKLALHQVGGSDAQFKW